MRRAIFQLASITAIICACSDDQGPRALGPEAVSQSVGTAGGTLVSKDGTLRLEIPAGALTSTRTITIDPIAASELGSAFTGVKVARAFELGPSGTVFDKPVTVSVRSNHKATVTDSSVTLRKQVLWTTNNGLRVGLDSTMMTVTGDSVLVSGRLSHFSPLAIDDGDAAATLRLTISVPKEAAVDEPFNVTYLAVFTNPASQFVSTLLLGFFNDRSTFIQQTLPQDPFYFQILNSSLSGVMEYKCPVPGLGTHEGVYWAGLQQSDVAATDPGKRVTLRLDTRKRFVSCNPGTSELSVAIQGAGSGKVQIGPAPAVTCTATCNTRIPEAATVQLTVTPDADSRFAGFTGQCAESNVPGVSVPLVMSNDRSCIVTFDKKAVHTLTISRTHQGTGTVTGGGLNCGETCTIQVPAGTNVELTATPSVGSRFYKWGPGCLTTTPSSPTIVVPVNSSVNCEAGFPLEQLNISVFPMRSTLTLGSTMRLDVVMNDETGPLTGRTVTFISGAPSVATVDAEGNVTAVGPGTAAIAVKVEGPGGGVVTALVTVPDNLFVLDVRKTGSGSGTTTLFNAGTGESTNNCDPNCPGTTTQFPEGSVIHVLATPASGSTFVGFLDGCTALPPSSTGGSTVSGLVQMNEAKTCTVEFGTAGPLSIAFGGLTSKSTGLSVALGSVSGTVYADYNVQNYPIADSLNMRPRINGSDAGTCFRANLAGTTVRCEINTALTDSSRIPGARVGLFKNGPGTLTLHAANQSGVEVATVTTPLTLSNTSFFQTITNNPIGATSNTWRGGEIKITIRPVIFEEVVNGVLTVTLAPTTVSGSGTLTLDGGPGNDPFTFTANPINSPTAQGRFAFAPIIRDGPTDITSSFGAIPPFEQNIDLVPPTVPFFAIPTTTFISGGVLVLDFATGPYPAGTGIPLSRISGGSVIPAHPPFCASAHVHGTIGIQRENSSTFDGPFADPRLGADCGHGSIVTENFSNVVWSFGGTITDASPVTTNIQMFEGVNGCDPAGPSFFDDIPILEGSGPGQSPFPRRTFTTNSFSGAFSLNVEGGMAEDNVCFRVDVRDSAVGPDGAPTNIQHRLLQTLLKVYLAPQPAP